MICICKDCICHSIDGIASKLDALPSPVIEEDALKYKGVSLSVYETFFAFLGSRSGMRSKDMQVAEFGTGGSQWLLC